jgi:DNA-binding MarR family transcriptional regulator
MSPPRSAPLTSPDSASAEPRWLDPDEMQAWLNLVHVTMRLPGALDRQLRDDAGIPHAHYQVLAMLSDAPDGTLRMSELARRSGTSQSRLSHAVASLEGRGWVTRRTCPSDRRGQLAELTGAGRGVLESVAPGHVEHVRNLVFDRLSAKETRQLSALLGKLLEPLDGPASSD